MTLNIQSRHPYFSNPVVASQPETQRVQSQNETSQSQIEQNTALAKESEPASDCLQKEFDDMQFRYNVAIYVLDGCGKHGQYHLNRIHAQMTQFISEHPEFKEQLPVKAICKEGPPVSSDAEEENSCIIL